MANLQAEIKLLLVVVSMVNFSTRELTSSTTCTVDIKGL